MNLVVLMGRLTRDMEIRYSQGENPTAIARGSLAIDRKFKRDGEPTADFINIVAFWKTWEFFEKFGKKGVKFVIQGRIQTGSYEKDGQRVYTTDIVVENVEFAESKNANQQQNNDGPKPSQDNSWMNIPDAIDENELPFN